MVAFVVVVAMQGCARSVSCIALVADEFGICTNDVLPEPSNLLSARVCNQMSIIVCCGKL
jgi:hypothetical protein